MTGSECLSRILCYTVPIKLNSWWTEITFILVIPLQVINTFYVGIVHNKKHIILTKCDLFYL
jgi:hypothetical protein